MSFLDKLKAKAGVAAETATGVANVAVSKTKTMASMGRVKLAISQEEDKLKKAYTELGRLFYRDHTAGVEADLQEYEPWCARAAEAKEQIAKLTEELEALKEPAEEPAAPVDDIFEEQAAPVEETDVPAEPQAMDGQDAE